MPGSEESCGRKRLQEGLRSLRKKQTLETQRNGASRVTNIARSLLQNPAVPRPDFSRRLRSDDLVLISPDYSSSVFQRFCIPYNQVIPMAHGHQHGAQQQGPFPLPGVNNIIAVGSGKGGVGKTTIAVNLAVALAKMGYKTGLLDADGYGPNVPLRIATSQQPRVLNENLIEPLQNFGVKIISVGFLNHGVKPIVWHGPRLHQTIVQFLQQVVWGELDYLVVYLPPGTGDVVISLFQTVPLTAAVVVSTPSDVSLQDGRKAIEMFRTARVDVLGLVENMSHFVCPHCHQEIDIFSKGGVERTAQQFGVPFLGSIELDPEIRKGGDSGKPAVLEGETSPHAKSFYGFAKLVIMRVAEVKSSAPGGNILQVQ